MASIKKLRPYGTPVLPQIYGESLSYMEILGKLEVQVNHVIDNVNECIDVVSGYDDRLSSVESGLSSLGLTVSALQGNVVALSGTVGELQTAVSGLSGSVSALSETVSGISSDLTGLTVMVYNLSARVSDAEGNITNLRSDLSALTETVNTISGDLANLVSGIYNLTIRVSNAETDIRKLEQQNCVSFVYGETNDTIIGNNSTARIGTIEFNSENTVVMIAGCLNCTATITVPNINSYITIILLIDGENIEHYTQTVNDGSMLLNFSFRCNDITSGNHFAEIKAETNNCSLS